MKTPDPLEDAPPKALRQMRVLAALLLVMPLVVTAAVWFVTESARPTIELGVSFAIACWLFSGAFELMVRSHRGDGTQ
jgi:hypothetical protein